MIDMILAIAEAAKQDTGTMIGIRRSTRPAAHYSVGQTLGKSYVWVDGERTEELLDGVSTIAPCCLRRDADNYNGDTMLVVFGHEAEYGQDPGELIISDAEVYAIINLKTGEVIQ